jgi:hypothetical protein
VRLKLESETKDYEQFLAAAPVYWRKNILPPEGDRFIVVEVFHQDIRVALRNLTIANAIRRLEPAHLVVVTGTDEMWRDALKMEFDVGLVEEFARAYGASDVIDIFGLASREAANPGSAELKLSFHNGPVPTRPPIDDATLERNAEATFCRLDLIPRLPQDYANDERYQRRRAFGRAMSTMYETLFAAGTPVAFVTSHVDYDQWGLGLESARRANAPVVHVQVTGSAKAYALFPETAVGLPTFRAELTRQIGTFYESQIWPQRERLRSNAELVAWRSKANLGRPSWWRGGAAASVEIANTVERTQLRAHGMAQLGFDPDKPVVAVFNHAVCDALWTNHEIFADLADWFEQTVEYARKATEANWLFLDHPSQALYDRTGFFQALAGRHTDARHMAFRRSKTITKNMLWSLTDLGLTVRGSVSNELPAYGIPVIQAGWSEWSACGLSRVAEDQESYWKLVESAIVAIKAGEQLITPEQVQRARLWLWFYRAGADVVSPLIPHWEVWPADVLLRTLHVTMRYVESDGDQLFAAVERMWRRREPLLTRFDFTEDMSTVVVPRTREATGSVPHVLS